MIPIQNEMKNELSLPAQSALVELWEIDLREFGGKQYFFCNQTNEKGETVFWKGVAYDPYPIKAAGFEFSGQGAANRPTLTVSNLMGLVTAAAEQFNQLVGVTVIRRQTYSKFLDGVNFVNGNPTADPNQEVVSKYVIERMTSMTAEQAVFELASPAESDGAVIPSRTMLANVCCWQYRGDGCGYTGRAVADRFDMPTDDPAKDFCSGTLLGCKARFGGKAALPYGGFPSCDKVTS